MELEERKDGGWRWEGGTALPGFCETPHSFNQSSFTLHLFYLPAPCESSRKEGFHLEKGTGIVTVCSS